MVQHALPLGATKDPAPQVIGACGHCGRPATERTLAADVVCCGPCWSATLRGERVVKCSFCGGGPRARTGCHGCKGRGVIYIPHEEGEV